MLLINQSNVDGKAPLNFSSKRTITISRNLDGKTWGIAA